MKLTASITGTDQVRASLLRVGASANKALAATAVEVEDYVEAESGKHNRKGKLVGSIYKRPIPGGWEIGHDPLVAPHALFVHWGTRPHDIRPRRKKALRWSTGGAYVFARKVRHPGYLGDAWLTRAAARAPAIFARHVQALISKEG